MRPHQRSGMRPLTGFGAIMDREPDQRRLTSAATLYALRFQVQHLRKSLLAPLVLVTDLREHAADNFMCGGDGDCFPADSVDSAASRPVRAAGAGFASHA